MSKIYLEKAKTAHRAADIFNYLLSFAWIISVIYFAGTNFLLLMTGSLLIVSSVAAWLCRSVVLYYLNEQQERDIEQMKREIIEEILEKHFGVQPNE